MFDFFGDDHDSVLTDQMDVTESEGSKVHIAENFLNEDSFKCAYLHFISSLHIQHFISMADGDL